MEKLQTYYYLKYDAIQKIFKLFLYHEVVRQFFYTHVVIHS